MYAATGLVSGVEIAVWIVVLTDRVGRGPRACRSLYSCSRLSRPCYLKFGESRRGFSGAPGDPLVPTISDKFVKDIPEGSGALVHRSQGTIRELENRGRVFSTAPPHGGSISAASAGPGRGAMIKVKLRTIESKSDPSDKRLIKRALKKEEQMPDTRPEGIKVVAVDDNPDARELLKVILERSKAQTAVVDSGQAALEAIKDLHPDVLICDLAIPEMDGYEVLENVRRLEPEFGHLPVIAFTAAARDEDRDAIRLPASKHIWQNQLNPTN